MLNVPSVRNAAGRAWDLRLWKPGHARLAFDSLGSRRRKGRPTYSDEDHLRAAAAWLRRAQDASRDGGVSGRYGLVDGWSSSYPETTGYIIPTLLDLAVEWQDPGLRQRAGRCVEFLLGVQLPTGAFPGREIRENQLQPSVFNTGQIVAGLTAWYRDQNESRALDSACRAADWMLSVQDPDGAWREHVYGNLATTYTAHASCWIAELGQLLRRTDYLAAAERHLEWVLRHRDPHTGWFELAGFSAADHARHTAVTHTLAYTLAGVLRSAEILGRGDGVTAVRCAADAVALTLRDSGWLPGVLDSDWRPRSTYACLTGNAQMALIWLRLHALTGEGSWLEAASRVIDLTKAAHLVRNANPGLRGGLPGSDPVWGDYLYNAVPNWAAKFFIDALLARRRCASEVGVR